MKYRKIHIVGGPGSGKTFSANKLSQVYGIPAIDLDEVFWDRAANDYNSRASESDRDQALLSILKNDSWIMEGVYYRWLSQSFEDADLIVILKPSVWIRHRRICIRFIKRKLGLVQSKNESISEFWALVKWNHKFDRDNLSRIRNFISEHKGKTVICNGYDDIRRMIANTEQGNPDSE